MLCQWLSPFCVGNSSHNYLTHLVQDGVLQQYRPVVFNQRGCGGIQLKVRDTRAAWLHTAMYVNTPAQVTLVLSFHRLLLSN